MDDVRLTSLFQQEFEWCRVRRRIGPHRHRARLTTQLPVRQLGERGGRGSATISGDVTDDAGD